jgi:hypothetical protein
MFSSKQKTSPTGTTATTATKQKNTYLSFEGCDSSETQALVRWNRKQAKVEGKSQKQKYPKTIRSSPGSGGALMGETLASQHSRHLPKITRLVSCQQIYQNQVKTMTVSLLGFAVRTKTNDVLILLFSFLVRGEKVTSLDRNILTNVVFSSTTHHLSVRCGKIDSQLCITCVHSCRTCPCSCRDHEPINIAASSTERNTEFLSTPSSAGECTFSTFFFFFFSHARIRVLIN